MASAADGSPCEDGDGCTLNDQCMAGTCQPGTAKACSATDECHQAGTCDSATGQCSTPLQPNGTACSMPAGGTCLGGACKYGYWSYAIGGANGVEQFNTIHVSDTGRIFLVGNETGVSAGGGAEAYFAEIDETGQVLNQAAVGTSWSEYIVTASAALTGDNIVVGGWSNSGSYDYASMIELTPDFQQIVRSKYFNMGGNVAGVRTSSIGRYNGKYLLGMSPLLAPTGPCNVAGNSCYNAQAAAIVDSSWSMSFDATYWDGAQNGVVALPTAAGDGYLMVAGSYSTSAQRWWLTRRGQSSPLWSASYAGGGATALPGANAAVETDSGFLVAGSSRPSGSEPQDAAFAAVNASGTVIATGTFGGAGDDIFHGVTRLADGGYLLVGRESGSGKSHGFAVKIDAAFNLVWQRSFGHTVAKPITQSGAFYCAKQLADGSIVLAGDRDGDAWVVHLPDDGNPSMAQPTYGSTSAYSPQQPTISTSAPSNVQNPSIPGQWLDQGYAITPITMVQKARYAVP